MPPSSATPRNPTGRRRGRPPGSTNAARAARQAAEAAAAATGSAEQPLKKRRYIPGGPGGGGRFVETEITPGATVSRTRGAGRDVSYALPSLIIPRRERSTRTRSTAADAEEEWGSAAAMAASVKQAEDYKPREERSWEEFHPNLDIDRPFLIFSAEQVDGIPQDTPGTPSRHTPATPANGATTPSRLINPTSTGNTPVPSTQTDAAITESQPTTPSRRPRRLTRDVVSFYGPRPLLLNGTPRTPKILPIQHQTPKEKLDLKLPSFRKTNRIELFEKEKSDQAKYVDKALSNVGYQESDNFIRPEDTLIRSADANAEDDIDGSPAASDETHRPTRLGRVEYDMDEQDDMWLQQYNAQRRKDELEEVTREIFEITMTRIEKEWHALERRIPKPNPKPPQTHRPRSSSAAAVNGEPQTGDEPDSKCVICDDGDCENTNAIVFCDGCNLAVHQECYGVPFIPEGQWLCRKCQLCGRGVPTCIFCPNTDGAFKQTNSSKWAHLLCAMWIPEVSLGNHTFMEPVMDVEKVPKTRWKLSCYICRQQMGACIQCSNKNCYQAFHVTCARRARLFLKMKTAHGTLAVLDGSMILKAFCDKHCPPDYTVEHNVSHAIKAAKKFYKRNMRGRIWASNHTMANVLAAQHRIAITEHPPDESQMTGAKNSAVLGDQDKGQPPKNLWKLPSGAPIIPQAVFDMVESSIQRFPFRKRRDYLGEACRYWTLKREARRGAALLKRLQLQMEAFSSMELTRRDFASMGPSGRSRLARRIDFAEQIIQDLGLLKELSEQVVTREEMKFIAAEIENEFVDECYFPVAKHLAPAIEKAISLDKDLFEAGLEKVQARVEQRRYTSALPFVKDLGDVINIGIHTSPEDEGATEEAGELVAELPSKGSFTDMRERRKLGKRILKAVQPLLESALRVESEISTKPYESLLTELESVIEGSLDLSKSGSIARPMFENAIDRDTIMVDALGSSEITVKGVPLIINNSKTIANEDAMDTREDGEETANDSIDVKTTKPEFADEAASKFGRNRRHTRTTSPSETPPDSIAYISMPQSEQTGPPTPPQSNGSLGREPLDPLAEGGVFWYLKEFDLRGTSIMNLAADVQDAESELASEEELSDVDDNDFKGVAADIDRVIAANAAEAGTARAKKVRADVPAPQKRRTSARLR